MKKILSVFLFITVISVFSITSAGASENVCTNWVYHSSTTFCDTNNGWCELWNSNHAYMKKTKYRRSCTSPNGSQWFEYREGLTKIGCCKG